MQKGVLTCEYHEKRLKKRALKYRLARRTDEVLKVIKVYKGNEVCSLLDAGTADGLMLDKLCQDLSIQRPVGVDLSDELLKTNLHRNIEFIQADATKLPFDRDTFDVVIATAVIEHVSDAGKMLSECYRVLKKQGLCIITTPDPFWDCVATKIGHLSDDQHCETFNITKLKNLFVKHRFVVVKAEKFMMSPIGFPYELKIEKFMRLTGLRFMLLNQLIVGEKMEG